MYSIVLVCPTPSAMRKMLSICDAFAVEYDIKFNAQKSKLSVVSPRNRHKQATYSFSVGDNPIERVESVTVRYRKSRRLSQWRMAKFDPLQNRNP